MYKFRTFECIFLFIHVSRSMMIWMNTISKYNPITRKKTSHEQVTRVDIQTRWSV